MTLYSFITSSFNSNPRPGLSGTSILPSFEILKDGVSKSVINGDFGKAIGNSKYGMLGVIAAKCNSTATPTTWHQVWGMQREPKL